MRSLQNSACAVLAACLFAFGCDEPEEADGGVDASVSDAGVDAAIPMDASMDDDGGPADAGADAGEVDAEVPMDGGEDAGSDAGPMDAGIDPSTIPAPRPIAPASGGFTTSFNVHFRWALTAPATGARVEICRDLACADVKDSFEVEGETGTRLVAPDPGTTSRTFYFRLTGTAGGVRGTPQSPVWSFSVHGQVGVTTSASWGSTRDFDGDRLSDVVAGAPASSTVRLYRGRSPIGSAGTEDTEISGTPPLQIGTAIFSAGDVNGDGLLDLAVGTATDLLIFHGVAGGFPMDLSVLDADTTIPAVTPTAATVAMAGDVDADGYADVVIADPATSSLVLHRGSATGLELTGAPLTGTAAGFGASVAGGCDVNADGYSDVIVGATDAAIVFPGSASGLALATAHPLTPGSDSAGFGASVACAGDVNGDGYPDVIVGAPDDDAAFIYHGDATATSTTADGILRKPPGAPPGGGTQQGDAFGTIVSAAGDVNGDGYGDVVVTAPEVFPDNDGFVGSAFVFHGGPTGFPETPSGSSTTHQRAIGATPPANRATVSRYAGDVDGDGFDDLVTGTLFRSGGVGAFLLNLGEATSTAPAGTAVWLVGGGTLTGFGTTLAR